MYCICKSLCNCKDRPEVVALPWRRKRCESSKKIFRRQSRESTSTHYYTSNKERAERRRGTATRHEKLEGGRGRGGCSSGGEGLRPRPQNNVRPRPTADNFPTKAGVERWRAVGARCTWRGPGSASGKRRCEPAMASRRASQSGGAPGREEAAGPEAAGALGRQGADRKAARAPVVRGLSDDDWALDVTKHKRQRGASDRNAVEPPSGRISDVRPVR